MENVTQNIYTETTKRGCNPSIVFTEEGSVFIDTAQLLTLQLEMREFALNHGPIKALINLEPHIDHIFGNHWFVGLPIYGHENLPSVFWKRTGIGCYEYSVDVLKRQDPEGLRYMPSKDKYIINPPNITFNDRMKFRLGNTNFELYYTPGHTDANISVYVPEEKTAFVADLVFNGCQTWLQTGDPFAWIKSLDFMYSLDIEHVVPGHGPVCNKEIFRTQKAFILEWMAAVADGISKGWSLEECKKNISFADRFPVDIGQEEMLIPVQEKNVEHLYEILNR